MINFIRCSNEEPYLRFRKEYEIAKNTNQRMIQAMCVSSVSRQTSEVNSRFVNLKFIDGKDLIFFSNYESTKSKEFSEHNQIAAIFYWNRTDTQIRIKGQISITSRDYNLEYFSSRNPNKNALAISSDQSKQIESFDEVIKRFELAKSQEDLTRCPEYWGGFKIMPHYFEFWKGDESRLNRRDVYKIKNGKWEKIIIQP